MSKSCSIISYASQDNHNDVIDVIITEIEMTTGRKYSRPDTEERCFSRKRKQRDKHHQDKTQNSSQEIQDKSP